MLCTSRYVFLCVACLAFLTGCSDPAAKYVGSYTGTIDLSGQLKKKAEAAGPAAMELVKAAKATLNLKEDKTYDVTFTMFGKNESESGNWSAAETVLTLKATSKDKVGSGGAKLSANEDGTLIWRNASVTITFTKS